MAVGDTRHLGSASGDELTPLDKADLVRLLNTDVGMPQGAMSVLAAIELMTESLVRLYEADSGGVLELPRLIGLRPHQRDT